MTFLLTTFMAGKMAIYGWENGNLMVFFPFQIIKKQKTVIVLYLLVHFEYVSWLPTFKNLKKGHSTSKNASFNELYGKKCIFATFDDF